MLCVGLLACTFASGQSVQRSEPLKPTWIRTQPVPGNSTFNYVVKQDWASSVEEARRKCLTDLVTESGLENGMVVVTDVESTLANSMVWENGKLVEKNEDSFISKSQMKGSETELAVKNYAEYWERDKYGQVHLYTLYGKSNPGCQARFDQVRLTNKYGADALARSIIPGWGQMYKGSTAKGILMLGGVAATAGGALWANSVSSAYRAKANSCSDTATAKAYSNQAQNMQLTRNICIGACAAIYIYNLIDAAVAPGATRVVPIVTPEGAAGVSYTKSF